MGKNRPNYPGGAVDGATRALSGGIGNIGCGTIGIFAAVLVLVVLGFSSTTRVETGHIGIVTNFGAATDKLLQPGLNFKIPFVEGVESFSIQTQKKEADAAAASRDLQAVNAKIAVNYHLDPTKVQEVFKTIGREYQSTVIDPQVQEAFKATTAEYTAEELITKREEVKSKARTRLLERLKRYNIIVDDFTIIDFDFASQEFKNVIEAKQVAAQEVLKAEQEKQLQAVRNAQAVAKADADKTVAITQAQGQAEAQKLQQQSLSDLYIQNKAIDKWDGKLPQFSGGNTPLPFIQVAVEPTPQAVVPPQP
jgi:regulator of protease activity HflC (stomatin/prohibitin superfamily)